MLVTRRAFALGMGAAGFAAVTGSVPSIPPPAEVVDVGPETRAEVTLLLRGERVVESQFVAFEVVQGGGDYITARPVHDVRWPAESGPIEFDAVQIKYPGMPTYHKHAREIMRADVGCDALVCFG